MPMPVSRMRSSTSRRVTRPVIAIRPPGAVYLAALLRTLAKRLREPNRIPFHTRSGARHRHVKLVATLLDQRLRRLHRPRHLARELDGLPRQLILPRVMRERSSTMRISCAFALFHGVK
jgi:hypothetical protein